MYNLEDQTITINDRTETILSFEVWWVVPFKGLFTTIEEAKLACVQLDLSPTEVLAPCPVAVSENLYEMISR